MAVADYLDNLVTDVQEAVDAQGITFLGTDIDHDGGKVILVAGAPSTSGDDEHRMPWPCARSWIGIAALRCASASTGDRCSP